MLQNRSRYEFRIEFRNFIGVLGAQEFAISTSSLSGIQMTTNSVGSLTFKRYFDYDLVFNLRYTECTLNGGDLELPRAINVQFSYLDSSAQNQSSTVLKSADQNSVTYRIARYSLDPDTNYVFAVKATLQEDELVFQQSEVNVYV